MSGWFSSDAVNTSSRLWKTCCHEAAHAVIRRKLGFTVTRIQIEAPGQGSTDFDLSRRLRKRWSPHEYHLNFAVGTMAGIVASERLQWFGTPEGCESDEDHVNEVVSHGVVTYDEVRAKAKRDVSWEWGKIKAEARGLYLEAVGRGVALN